MSPRLLARRSPERPLGAGVSRARPAGRRSAPAAAAAPPAPPARRSGSAGRCPRPARSRSSPAAGRSSPMPQAASDDGAGEAELRLHRPTSMLPSGATVPVTVCFEVRFITRTGSPAAARSSARPSVTILSGPLVGHAHHGVALDQRRRAELAREDRRGRGRARPWPPCPTASSIEATPPGTASSASVEILGGEHAAGCGSCGPASPTARSTAPGAQHRHERRRSRWRAPWVSGSARWPPASGRRR